MNAEKKLLTLKIFFHFLKIFPIAKIRKNKPNVPYRKVLLKPHHPLKEFWKSHDKQKKLFKNQALFVSGPASARNVKQFFFQISQNLISCSSYRISVESIHLGDYVLYIFYICRDFFALRSTSWTWKCHSRNFVFTQIR